ncbi:MAG TPA: rhomboid family intramembrane serine protease [Anaerolineae bacterium]
MRGFIARLKIAFQVILALLLAIWLLNFLDSAVFERALAQVVEHVPFVTSVETAVKAVGILFITVWGMFFIDGMFFSNNLRRQYGVQPHRSLNPARFFTSPLLHGSYDHLWGNTRHLLFFSGITLLMLAEIQAFILVTIVVTIVEGAGMWLYGDAGTNHLGASGLVLGYFSFILAYGFLIERGVWAIVAVALALLFGRRVYRLLRFPGGNVSFAGHLWGFMGGIIAAYVLSIVAS